MKPWLWPALIVLVPCGSVIALGIWIRRLWQKEAAAHADLLIKPPNVVKGMELADEKIRQRTEAKRRAGDELRQQAARVESGGSTSTYMRRVK